MHTSDSRETLRFGDFELDIAAYELRRRGRAVKLGRQPMDLLILLVQSRRQLVSRGEIVDRLWGKDVFVDVETGVNTAISKIRQALRDSAEAPAFVETVPGKGYRFIAAVELAGGALDPPASGRPPEPAVAAVADPMYDRTEPPRPEPAGSPPGAVVVAEPDSTAATARRLPARALAAIGLAAVALAIGAAGWMWLKRGEPTLAVLPFENLGSDDYLAAGLTDETSAWLAQIGSGHLRVKGRTSAYKRSTKTVTEIGQELAVDYLVQGSIRAEGGRLRVTVTLIRVRDQEHVWSRSYEREPASLLGLQQELSTAIAEQIQLRLSPARLSGLEFRQSRNHEALDAYLRGRYEVRRRNPEGNRRATQEFNRAVAIDPDYALAWSGLSFTYAASTVNGDAPPGVVGPLARAAAGQAIRANPGLSEAQLAHGYELWLIERDQKGAEAALRRAIELDSSNAAAHRVLGHALSQSGRHNEAAAEMRGARDLDPLDPVNFALSSQVAFQARDPRGALDLARRAISIDSSLWIGYVQLGQAHAAAGDSDLALEAFADAARFSGGNSKPLSFKGHLLAKLGRTGEAREVLRTLEAASRTRYVPAYAMALVHAGLGEADAVFTALEQAFRDGDVHLMYLAVDEKWDPYRADPRFGDLIARCGFATVR